MVIYLDEYRAAKAMRTTMQDRYERGQACVNAGAVAIFGASCFQRPIELRAELPEDLTSADLDEFLGHIYALASQF